MDFLISPALAQAAPAAGQPGLSSLLLPILFFVFLYFVMIRPQMKRAKEHRAMVSALARGDEVVAAGGILGRIEDIGDATLVLEIAPGVSVKVQRNAVVTVLPKGTLKST